MKALVVNCSTQYNLGAMKLANWLEAEGWQVDREYSNRQGEEPPLRDLRRVSA